MTIPGPSTLISGTMEEGFFGEVPANELITGDALASECGISQGTSQHSTAGWLKFAYKGKILFVAKKPIRHSISWDAINTAKCVYGDSGDKTVTIDGLTYKVTLMRATNLTNDPKTVVSETSGAVNHHSEWNRLMCQIHEEAINGSWGYPNNIESNIGILKHSLGSGSQGMYSDADLIVAGGDGRRSWCQEMGTSTSSRLYRGNVGVSYSHAFTSSITGSTYGWRPVLELHIPPIPGPPDLIAGDMQAGYFGTVSADELITGDALCSAIGLSAGTSQHSNTDWLKFAYKGKIQFVAMKPIRYSLSWDDINAAGAIYGKNITIGGLTYKVRSFRGAEHDPTNSYADPDKDAIGSEWNDLMLPLHERAATGSWAYPEYAGTVPNWGIGFTGADLLTHYSYGSGSSTWCQEVQDTNTGRRINRGYNEIAYSRGTRASTVSAIYGFRPVLELPGADFLESILDSVRHSENFLYPRSKYRPIVLLTNVNTTIKSGRVRLVVSQAVSHCMEHFLKGCNKLRSANYIASVKTLSDSFRGRIRISREVLGIKLSKLRIKSCVTLVKDRISLSVLAAHTRGKAVAVKIITKVNEIANKYRQITRKVKTATHNLTNLYQNRRLTRALVSPQKTKHRSERLTGLFKLLVSRLHTVTSSGRSLGMVKNLKDRISLSVLAAHTRGKAVAVKIITKVNEIANKYRQITQKVKTATHNLTNFYQNRRLTRALVSPQETKHRDKKLIGLSKLLFSRLHTVTSSGRSLGMVKNLKASLQIVTVSYSRIRNWTMRLFGKIEKSGSLLGKVKSGSLRGR